MIGVRNWNRCLPFAFLLAISALRPVSALGQAANAEPQSLTLPQYIAQLDRCAAVLNAVPINRDAVRQLHATLPPSWTVTSGSARYTLDMAWLSAGLAGIEQNASAQSDVLAQTRERLDVYLQEARSLERPASASENSAQARGRLDKILSAKEFRGQNGPSWTDVALQRVRDWINRQLERIFGPLRARQIGNIVAWSLVSLVGLLLMFWTLRLLLRPGERADMDLRGATPIGRDWRKWLREAREAAKRGDYRAAIHAAYWAAIVRMEEMKTLPEDRSRTPRESLKLIDRGSPVYAPLLQLTRRFELVWYGYRAATPADWDDAAHQLETLGCPRS